MRWIPAAAGIFLTVAMACQRRAHSEAHPGPARSSVKRSPSVASTAVPQQLPAEERTWTFESTPFGRMVALVLLPERMPQDRFPVLFAFHGRGEALKGPDLGARGWVDDYWLSKAIERLRAPPLTPEDFQSFVSEERLGEVNRALALQRYRGLVIVCPYTPDALAGPQFFDNAEPFARFVVDSLLPRVVRETPAIGGPATTGIDGVSLGGRAAFGVGLARPEAFGVIAGFQAAFDRSEVPALLEQARTAKQKNSGVTFRLLTSRQDYFKGVNESIAQTFRAAGLSIRFDVALGPHDYAFNRGPGAYEMLLFHDRALRGEAPP